MYDITNKESFIRLATKYSEYLNNDPNHDYRLRATMLIGTKNDRESERQVSSEAGLKVRYL